MILISKSNSSQYKIWLLSLCDILGEYVEDQTTYVFCQDSRTWGQKCGIGEIKDSGCLLTFKQAVLNSSGHTYVYSQKPAYLNINIIGYFM